MKDFCNGEMIGILTVVMLCFIVIYTVQPAKDNLKPHPVYEVNHGSTR